MATAFGATTAQGFDAQIGTNHVGHYQLTKELLPQLKQGASSRIVNVSSGRHVVADMTIESLPSIFHPTAATYGRFSQYANTKLANILHAKTLNAEHAAVGVTAYSCEPGLVASDLGPQSWYLRLLWTGFGWLMKTPDEGAATSVYTALSEEAAKHPGGYFKECAVDQPTARAQEMRLATALRDYPELIIRDWHQAQQQEGNGRSK
jgi:NAD(P)-dependent dehydrogenase (short-subunit alcohol dehydrogenase family)